MCDTSFDVQDAGWVGEVRGDSTTKPEMDQQADAGLKS